MKTSHFSRFLRWTFFFIVSVTMTGMVYQTAASEADNRNFPSPGNLIDVGGFKMHIHCEGEGSPTVILEAMSGGTSPYWGWVQPAIQKETQVCVYDRAGRGWSEPDSEPISLARTVRNLHALLEHANLDGPFLLVGHSIGGIYVRRFAADAPDSVAGMVLVDSAHPLQFVRHPEMLQEGENYLRLSAAFPAIARLGVNHLYFALGGEMDFAGLPERQKSEVKAFWSSPEYFRSQRAEIEAGPEIWSEARTLGDLGDLPLIVVSRGQGLTYDWPQMQEELAGLSTNSLRITVEGSSHGSLIFVQKDADLVTEAILKVIEAARSGSRLEE